MLRSAQMVLGYCMRRHYLGRDWKCNANNCDKMRQSKIYCDIINWFTDYPGPSHYYSIHHLVQCGLMYDILPGEWFGPSTAALVLRDMTR